MEKEPFEHVNEESVQKRLAKRKRLAEMAFAIVNMENQKNTSFCQEEDTLILCVRDAAKQGNINHFVCNKLYTCPSNFQCNTTRRSYDNCGGAEDFYQCSTQTPKQAFTCHVDKKTADYFDCSAFACELPKDTSSFDCNSIVDFLCGGVTYICDDDFACTGGHGFFCTNQHDCGDQFTCSGGTVAGCPSKQSTNPLIAVSCKQGPNVNGYGVPGGNDNNTVPGDFFCAWIRNASDTFDCYKKFDCEAKSDFSCQKSGEFTCAQIGNAKASNFTCGTDSRFECFAQFTCASENLFHCSESNIIYKCKSSYAECRGSIEKECEQKYQCVAYHACNGTPREDYECQSPKFDCSTSAYDCTLSIPAYTSPPPSGS